MANSEQRGRRFSRLRTAAGLAARGDWPELRVRAEATAWRWDARVHQRLQRRLNFTGRHRFDDRSRGRDRLAIVLAGYKRHLWPYTLPRLERHVPDDLDVCLVSPGTDPPELEALARRNGWSRLITERNALSLAQNLAIRHHPAARWIHKLDEDIFIAEGHFDGLQAGYERVRAEGRFRPGFAAPVLNVNGFSYRLFLEALGLEEDYRRRFGELLQSSGWVKAQNDGAAARWLWEHSLPIEKVAARFAARPFGYSPLPHRFSIGAILYERDLWEEIGGFVTIPGGGVGDDEAQLCRECVNLSRIGVVIHDVFAGHFSFGEQDAQMRAALPELTDRLLPAAQKVGKRSP
jgi:hypothetical protein